MNFSELLQVAAISSFLTLALILLLGSSWRWIKSASHRLLPPRYLKSRGVRTRSSVDTGSRTE